MSRKRKPKPKLKGFTVQFDPVESKGNAARLGLPSDEVLNEALRQAGLLGQGLATQKKLAERDL